MAALTAVATGCSPECNWGIMINELGEAREACRVEIVQAGEDLQAVERDFLGLTGLRMSLENCQAGRVEACGPENYATGRVGWGHEVEVAIKSIRGE